MKHLCFVICLLLIFISSCSEDFLIREPMGITDETVFANEKGPEALLIGTYGIISGGATWEVSWGASVTNWTYGSVASGLIIFMTIDE